MNKTILFLNLGGPEKQSDVKSFLYRLFEDPNVIRIPFTPLRKFVAWAISTSREKKSQQMYAKIGGGSPIRRLTDDQSRAVEDALAKRGFSAQVKTAFTCSAPLVEDVVRDAAKQGATDFLALPLYPQFSLTTTRGAFDRSKESVKEFAPNAGYHEQGSFPAHPLFVKAHADLIRRTLKALPESEWSTCYLVFSAHSIPEKLVTDLGDPYEKEMSQSVQGILRELNWKGPFAISWQSKLGPVKWLEPSTEDTIRKIAAEGGKSVCVVPIAFVTDHIETLYELDQELSEVAAEVGLKPYLRVPGLNNHPLFIECLVDLITNHPSFSTTK